MSRIRSSARIGAAAACALLIAGVAAGPAIANLGGCTECVEASDIATGAVRAAELGNDLNDSIDENDIATGGIGSAEITNGSVAAADLAASAQPSIVTKDGSSSVVGSVGNTCTNLDSITIDAAASGNVTVDVDVHLNISHTNGDEDWFQVVLATSSDACSLGQSEFADRTIDASEPTGTDYGDTLHVMETFAVTAGSHTYYVNVKWPFGGDSGDSVSYPNLRAMFIPN